jgi:hypothetical protein
MDDFPIICPRCKLVFPFFGLRGTALTVTGLKIGCPRCFYPVELPDATYTGADDGRITITDYSPRDREVVEVLRQLLRSAHGDGDEEAVIRGLESIDPALGTIARRAKARGGIFLLISILVYLLHSCSLSSTVDINKLIDQATQILAQNPDAEASPTDGTHTQAQENDDKEPRQSRQQRRQQERQSKKTQPSPERSTPPRDTSPPKGKKGGARKSK